MRTRAWGAVFVAACGITPATALGQGPPGTNLSVDVRVSSVRLKGDTARVEYVLSNRAKSAEALVFFTVNAPAPPISVSLPEPSTAWDTGTTYRDRSVASWAALNTIAKGAGTPPLSFRAIGLPAIVTAWYRGNSLPTIGEDDPDVPEPDPTIPTPDEDPLETHSVAVQTIGVEPLSLPVTPQTLTMRLHRLTRRSCALGWISDAALCYRLREHLDAEPWFQAQPIRLVAFLRELIAGHIPGGPVSDNAYWLLKTNAEYIVNR